MSRLKKIVKIIYCLLLIVLLHILLLLLGEKAGYDTVQYINIIFEYPNFVDILAVISEFAVVIVIIQILTTLFKKTDEKYLLLSRDNGTISVSDSVIKKTVESTLNGYKEVLDYDVKVKIKNKNKDDEKVDIKIKCGLDEAVLLEIEADNLYADIQVGVHMALKELLYEKVGKVNIKYYETKSVDKSKKTKESEETITQKRVK